MKEKWFVYRRMEPSQQKESTFFRKCFTYDGNDNVIANITADTRYLLYVNSCCVCRGPESGDACRKYYDEVDITEFLHKGTNCIGVQVIHYPMGDDGIQRFAFGPTALAGSLYGGLCVFSKDDRTDIDTDGGWKYLEDEGYEFRESQLARYAGDVESVDFKKRPFGWTCPEFDDSGWKAAVPVQAAGDNEVSMEYGILRNWVLKKRDIPGMEEQFIRPAAIHNSTNGISFNGLLLGERVVIPPEKEAVCEIDMGRLVTSYVRSDFASGSGRVEYLYSECYYQEEDGRFFKNNREERENGVLIGETDEVILAGGPSIGQSFTYEPFEYRAFRFLRLTVRAGSEPVVLNGISFRQTNYPLAVQSAFEAEDKSLERIWEVSLHTLKCCMQDSYIDCPYYERLQYVMDAMIEALNTYCISGDDRLARKALLDFSSTQMPNGMIHCDAPSNDRHVIPGYAVYFIDMLYQHYWYFKDVELVKQYWAVCARLLRYFEEREDEATGLIRDCGYWEFVDWTKEWDSSHGVPRGKGNVHYIYSMMYAYGLMRMGELTEAAYGSEAAVRWKRSRRRLIRSINKEVFNQEKGYYSTCPGEAAYSQHAQIWAVMSGCAEGRRAGMLMNRVAEDTSLIKCSYPMQYYYNRAMEKAGSICWKQPMWQEYRELLEKGVTTWPEDPVSARSDCHGWSTIPIYEICHVLLGIKPAEPGFTSIVIEPKLFQMGSMEGTVWTPRGLVRARRLVKKCETGIELEFAVTVPQKTQMTFRLAGQDILTEYCSSMELQALLSEEGKLLIKIGRCEFGIKSVPNIELMTAEADRGICLEVPCEY